MKGQTWLGALKEQQSTFIIADHGTTRSRWATHLPARTLAIPSRTLANPVEPSRFVATRTPARRDDPRHAAYSSPIPRQAWGPPGALSPHGALPEQPIALRARSYPPCFCPYLRSASPISPITRSATVGGRGTSSRTGSCVTTARLYPRSSIMEYPELYDVV